MQPALMQTECVFEPLFSDQDAIISDSLNHASIIDGVRLCKAKRYRYANADMNELEKCLQEVQAHCFRYRCYRRRILYGRKCSTYGLICDLGREI